MNKKFLGIRIGTVLMALLSVIVAAILWFYVEYDNVAHQEASNTAMAMCDGVYNEL